MMATTFEPAQDLAAAFESTAFNRETWLAPPTPPDVRKMRSGCIPCLQDRRTCSNRNPSCRRSNVSTRWRINHSVVEQWHGTWRERYGYHMFIYFTNAPERAGHLDYGFWQHTIPLLCFRDQRLYCLASALGSLYEYVSKATNDIARADRKTLAFALHQCGRAIRLLTQTRQKTLELEVALTACILLTHFESLQGCTRSAILQCLQGGKLLAGIDRSEPSKSEHDTVILTQLHTTVLDLELQARCVPGVSRPDGDPLVLLKQIQLPSCRDLKNISHAGALLSHAHIRLLNIMNKLRASRGQQYFHMVTEERHRKFVPWLESWSTAFERLADRERKLMTPRTKLRYDILRINHKMLCIFCEFDAMNGDADWGVRVSDFEYITGLLDSILSTYEVGANPSLSSEHFPFLTHGLWMLEPLFITAARCPDREVKSKAANILLARRCLQTTAWSSHAAILTGEEDVMSVDHLIDFAENIRLDIGLAMFFGGFQRHESFSQYSD